MALTSAIIKQIANNICYNLHWSNGDKNISHHNIQQVGSKHSNYGLTFNFGNITKFKIIYNNIPHTPSKVGVMVRIIFSLTLDEAMSVGLAKACVLREKSILL